mgnify:CR=1 FL=1
MLISTVTGESREAIRTYPDGSVDCPFCTYPIITPSTCQNPWCDANSSWTPDALIARQTKRREEAERITQETTLRKSVARAAKERHAEHQAWEVAQIAEARRRGACLHCLFAPGWERVRFVVHRQGCPKVQKEAFALPDMLLDDDPR